jgi:hypothetical protein
MKPSVILVAFQLFVTGLWATPPSTTTQHIKIDQFGYLPFSKKIAVIVDPQTGYNAAESFNPGTGANQYQVRRWSDNFVVFNGTLTAWNGGATHTQSGDKGWWFDFSTVTTIGSYYIYDVVNNVGSYRFEINTNVYDEVLKQALRTFYYQRINFAKAAPYTDAKWADAACFERTRQDRSARSATAKNNAGTARDLHGGWMDAGDYNKYVTFTVSPLTNMLETYRAHPTVFLDNYNIPESGNSVPDILDEIKWEIDWLKRMQDGTGTNGFFIKMGADNYNASSPASADANFRYYVGECTSSTLSGCAVFALAGTIYKSLPGATWTTYGNDLITRAGNAWIRAKSTTSNFTVFQTTCDNQDIKAGDADIDVATQKDIVVAAAAYLFEATGLAEYKNCFDTMYLQSRPISGAWWGPYHEAAQRSMLRYTTLAEATPEVVAAIRASKAAQNDVASVTDYNNATDLYLAHMPDGQYHWGSNQVKGNAGTNNYEFIRYNINTAQHPMYNEVGNQFLHYFHGVNPQSKIMLSNMYSFGGDNCVNEMYHNWFSNGSNWDNVQTSLYGPPPGYVIGGVNQFFSLPAFTPPVGQPPLKAYKEWNTGWNGSANENSWEITEPAIYNQASYISLLARVIANAPLNLLPLHITSFTAVRNNDGALVSWSAANIDEWTSFEVQRSLNGQDFTTVQTITAGNDQSNFQVQDNDAAVKIATVYYRIKQTDKKGDVLYSAIVRLPLKRIHELSVKPNPVLDNLVISGSLESGGKIVLTLHDVSGKIVVRTEWQQPTGRYTKNINLSGIAKGTYWLKLNSHTDSQPLKIVKQ